jgi:hypothetical protein
MAREKIATRSGKAPTGNFVPAPTAPIHHPVD